MPGFTRYYPVYLGCLVIFATLAYAGYLLKELNQVGAIATFVGICVAFTYVLMMNWWKWRATTTQNTLSALSNLRQNQQYLLCVTKVKRRIGPFGTPILPEQVDEILRRESNASINNPSFSDASLFVLNQYEFLAAAARMGAMDFELLERTTKSNLCDAVRSFQPLILRIRKEYKKEHFENLVWLYRRFEGYDGYILGPGDEVPNWLKGK